MSANPSYTRDTFCHPWATVGEHTYGAPTVVGGGPAVTLTIGRYCAIAPGVEIELAGDHHINKTASYPFDNIAYWDCQTVLHTLRRPLTVTIGHDVWLATGSRIVHGVTVGHGAVVAAYAVVVKDVRPYAVVGGNPAAELYRRFSDEVVEALLEIAWWDWPEEKIRANMKLITGKPDIEGLRNA